MHAPSIYLHQASLLAVAMSCIHLHLGQAGIQLGESFWGLAEEEFVVGDGRGGRNGGGRGRTRVRMHPGGAAMFHEDGGWARCLAVDSEPKVSAASQVTGIKDQMLKLRIRLSVPPECADVPICVREGVQLAPFVVGVGAPKGVMLEWRAGEGRGGVWHASSRGAKKNGRSIYVCVCLYSASAKWARTCVTASIPCFRGEGHPSDLTGKCLSTFPFALNPQVVQRFQGRVGSLRPENAVYSQSGLANNWAMGFASCR